MTALNYKYSQNHRIAKVRRDLRKWFKSLLKQSQLEQIACYCIPLGFEYLKGWRLHSLFRQPIPVFDHSQGKEVPLCLNGLLRTRIQYISISFHPVIGCKQNGIVRKEPSRMAEINCLTSPGLIKR